MNHDHDTFGAALGNLKGNSMKRVLATLALVLASACAFAQPVISTQNLNATGACTANSCVLIDMRNSGSASAQITGTYTASGGLSLQRSNNSTNWETVSANAFIPVGGTGTATITSGSTGTWNIGGCVGFRFCRVVALGAVTGSASVEIYQANASVGGTTSISGGAGDASAANQVTGNASLASIDGKLPALVSSRVPVDPSGVTSPISAASLPLPTGASTAANQSTGNTSLSNIDTDLGAAADSACGSDNGSCSLAALIKRTNQNLTTVNTSVNTAPTYQGTPGSAAPASVLQMGVRSGANSAALTQANASVPIGISTATTTQLVALSSGQVIHVTAWDVIAGGTGTFRLVYGTGTNCGTGTTNLTGAYPLIANAGISKGGGLGPILVVPAGNALCATTSAAVTMDGSVSYTQFTP